MNDIERIANLTSTDIQTIRLMLQNGCDFGTAIKKPNSKRYTYVLYPEKVRELFGFEVKGKVEHDKRFSCNDACNHNSEHTHTTQGR